MTMPTLISYIALWVLVSFQGFVLIGLLRIVYRLQAGGVGPGGLSPGEAAPWFTAPDLAGAQISTALFAGRRTILLFVSTECGSCRAALEDISHLIRKVNRRVVVVCAGQEQDCRALSNAYQLEVPVIADEDLRVTRLYRIATVPTAVLIGESGEIEQYGNPTRDGQVLEEPLGVGEPVAAGIG